MSAAGTYRDVAEEAWSWVLGQVRDDDGPWLPDAVDGEPRPAEDRDSFYAGIGGLAPVLAEIRLTRSLTDREEHLAAAISARLTAIAEVRTDASLYDGLGGDITALMMLEPGREHAARRRLIDRGMDVVTGPAPVTDLISGTAGVVLAATWAAGDGSDRLMTVGGESLLRAATPTDAGLDWRMTPGYASSTPNYSHGTAGVATALTIAGHALAREDFLDAARRGVRHLLSVARLDDDGFVVPHTLPYSTSREVEPVTYNWCHGPSGTSQLFAALAHAGVDEVDGYRMVDLRRRCLRSVLTSGLPERLRPGFWDNDGRCCGTAGVADIVLDAAQDSTDEDLLAAASTLGDALVDRAVRDGAGARWRFIEYRRADPLLPPATSWMQGAAGIAAYLLRLARVTDEGLATAVIDRPDQWWTVPARFRTIHSADG